MGRKTTIIAALVLLLVGMGVLIYPTLSDYVNRINGSYAIRQLNEQIAQAEQEAITEQRRRAMAYNAALSGGADLPEGYEEIMDFGNGIMGYLQIPKIRVSLPIYHGVSEAALSKGVGHLPQSAFPIGGAGNHAVLSGHTGLPGAQLLTDLVDLQEGDRFYIHVLEDTMAYQVDQIKVVLPQQSRDLRPAAGEDYCTLVTCTPYGINSHRLLVRGVRVEMEEVGAAQQLQEEVRRQTAPPWSLIAVAAAAGAVLVCIAVLILKKE